MRAQAKQSLRELHWLVQAECDLRRARNALEKNPQDAQLKALVQLMEELVSAGNSPHLAA